MPQRRVPPTSTSTSTLASASASAPRQPVAMAPRPTPPPNTTNTNSGFAKLGTMPSSVMPKRPAAMPSQPTQPRPTPQPNSSNNSSGSSAKSVKAQAAANMLTDVLRQLARKDPSLATLKGVGLDKAQPESGAQCDDATLDAKLAEAEKLIIDMHKN
ncbi:hypothetical protein GGF37_007242 [Kickxella alabastrina]|nr:hypothetical protein GGF37_007242 [Kickxella alabastrina]